MLFWLNIEDKKKILALELKEKELNKPMTVFSKYKHILIFDRLLQFIYGGFDKLEEMAK